MDALHDRALDTIVFSGYTVDALLRRSERDTAVARALRMIDLLVDGPFLAHRVDRHRPWLGSTNQRFLPLSGRGHDLLPGPEDRDGVEVTVGADGAVRVNGWLDPLALRDLASAVRG